MLGFIACLLPGIWLARRVVPVPAGAAVRAHRPASRRSRRSYSLIKRRWWASFLLVLVGNLLVSIIGVDRSSSGWSAIADAVSSDNTVVLRDRAVIGSTASAAVDLPVPGRGADDPVLRPAGAQGGLRPPAAGRGLRRRARPGRAAARTADRRRDLHARAARRGALLAAAARLDAAAGRRAAVAVGVSERVVGAVARRVARAAVGRRRVPAVVSVTRPPGTRCAPTRSPTDPLPARPDEPEPPPSYPSWSAKPPEQQDDEDDDDKPDGDRADWLPPEAPRGPGGL